MASQTNRFCLFCSVLFCSWPLQVWAESSLEIEEVLVTASKRETAAQSTPIAINAFESDDIEFRSINDVQDLRIQVSSLNYGEILGNPQISIRGVGLPLVTGDAEQGVASHIDGLYLARPTMSNVAMGDLERIEVLRGPQGTLYGRSATGGTINYITRKPTESLDASVTVGGGSFGSVRVKGHLSGPLVEDQVLLRAFAMFNENDGYIDRAGGDDLGERDAGGGSLAMRLLPADSLTVDAQLIYYEDDGSYASAEALETIVNYGPPFTPQPGQFDPNAHSEIHDYTDSADSETLGGILTLEWKPDNFTIKSIAGYYEHERGLNHDFDFSSGTFFDFLSTGRRDDSETFTFETTVAGSTGLDWIVGVYYLNDESSAESYADPVRGLFFDFGRELEIESYAVFGEVTVPVSDRFSITAGLRASQESQDGLSFAVIQTAAIPPCAAGGEYEEDYDKVTPKAGFEFDLNENALVYGRYQKGHKPGGLNVNSCLDQYDEELIDAYELGYKARLLENRLTLNAAAFYYDYEDLQTFKIVSFAALIENAPKAEVTGVELEFQLRANDYFSVDGGLTWLDAEYKEFSDSDSFIYGPFAQPEDLSGNALNRVPEFSAVLGVNLEYAQARFRAEMSHSSSYYLRRFNRDFSRQGTYTMVNLYASLHIGDQFEVRVFGKNITDEEYLLTLFDNTSNGQTNGVYGRPREWGVDLSYRL